MSGKSPGPRKEFFYFNDDGSLVALRYDQYKIVFAEQRAQAWISQDPFVPLRFKAFQSALRSVRDRRPREHRLRAVGRVDHAFVLVPAQQYVGQFLASFKEFTPSQKPGSFSLDDALYNQMALLEGKGPSTRHEVFYFGGPHLGAVRLDDFNLVFRATVGLAR